MLAKIEENDEPVAYKEITETGNTYKEQYRKLKKEFKLMSKCNHKNVL